MKHNQKNFGKNAYDSLKLDTVKKHENLHIKNNTLKLNTDLKG